MFTKSKVQFQDQQIDDYLLENSVLKSKLQSKVDALAIMNMELDKCNMERDKYKMLVEQLQHKEPSSGGMNHNICRFTLTNDISANEILTSTRDHNCELKVKIETLQNKLEEANGDILALRKQLQKESLNDNKNNEIKKLSQSSPQKDYEQLVQSLESIQNKYKQLQLDYGTTLDEKEELVADRDYYKSKVNRLNHHISYILSNENKDSNPHKSIVDIDALVMENKYLHERITQLQVEKEIIKRTLTKYKTLLDNRENGDHVNLKKGFADVMTQKQVREYLNINTKTGLKRSSAAELKSLCLGLIEALNDKSIALQHQRKTNHEEEFNKNNEDNQSKEFAEYENGSEDNKKFITKTVLPLELEQLVKEALADLKPIQ
ncbi:unnamed protein product, partial [Iphiclides podalirius]